MAGSPSAQDVADALAMTLEREDAAGAPWCPPADGVALRRWVTDRSAQLGGGVRRVVRLARLMAITDGGDYIRFLYVRLTVLRARQFRQLLERAAAEGRLHTGIAKFSENGVRFCETELAAPDGGAFDIDYGQMPRLAALLDFLHNSLGFAAVADVLAPLLRPDVPTSTANEIARSLHAALSGWLGERLESANHLLQAQRIRAFLANRGRIAPEAIDDEAILAFWIATAESNDERIDGFRLYRSLACTMLRYRNALRDAAAARHLEDAVSQGLATEADAFLSDRIEGRDATIELWRSPLASLISAPANRVKWLTRKEQQWLFNYLGGRDEDEIPAEADGEENEGTAWKDGLSGDERFDVAFWLTLLRADVLGAAQASIVARLRKRVDAGEAIAQATVQLDDAAYTNCTTAYVDVRNQLNLECLAALAALMDTGATEAIILLAHLAGAEAATAIVGPSARELMSPADDEPITDQLRRIIRQSLSTAMSEPSTVSSDAARNVLVQAAAAARKVSRAGFRREDRADPEILAGLQAGAAPIVELIRELDRLTETLAKKAPIADLPSDRIRFMTAFRHIYLSARADEA